MPGPHGRTDVHQHLWPPSLLDALRRRRSAPMLRGWTLHTAHEPPYGADPDDHDIASRVRLDADTHRVLVSLSSPLGIEQLPPDEAEPLLDAWHAGARELPAPFAAWASVHASEPDLDALAGRLASDFVGLQLPATQLLTPAAVETSAAVLSVCERLDRPVLVHPGPMQHTIDGAPPWWPAVVDYVAQLQSAWWAWRAVGRGLFPRLRICFVAGAGLAPLHHERMAARGAGASPVDRDAFVDTSSYGRQAIDALTRALGIDVVVLGSDRPYAEPADLVDLNLGDAAQHAVTVTNPLRLLEGRTA